jgi:hypothetical protein
MAPSVAVLQRAVIAGVRCAEEQGRGAADLALGSPARAKWIASVEQKAAAKAARRRIASGGEGSGGGSGAAGGAGGDEGDSGG